MDPQEIEQFREQVRLLTESLQGLNQTTDQSAATISKELSNKFPNSFQPATAALGGLGNAATSVASALYKGERGMHVMADGMDKFADGLQIAAALFTTFTPMGKALGTVTKIIINGLPMLLKIFTGFNKMSAEQSDALFKTYQDLSKIGAVGAGGLENLFANLQQMGFTKAELDQFGASIKKNAKDLTLLGATAQSGAQKLGEVSGAILKSDMGNALQKLGYSAEDLADSTMTYINLQTRLGRVQGKTTAELALEGAKFALELDKMARLTGISREEQEQARKSLMEDERYAAFMAGEAREKGYDVQGLESFLSTITNPETRKGLQHLAAGGGAATSEEARRVMFTDPQAYQRMLAVMERRQSAVTAAQGFAGAQGQYAKTYAGVVRYTGQGPGVSFGGAGGAVMSSERMASMQAAADKAGMSLEEFAKSEQKMAEFDKGELARQVDTRRQQMNINQTLDTTVNNFKVLNNASAALTSAFDNATAKMGGTPAGGRATTAGGGGGGAAGGAGAMGQGTPDLSGLRIKSGESTAGGGVSPALVELARNIQNSLGGNLKYFSAFNDSYHQGTNSAHAAGRALDFTLNDPSAAAQVAAMIRSMPGVKYVQDEYSNPSSRATGGHIHAEINGAAGFRGMLSGPMGGYNPNLLMHGDEELSVRPMGVGTVRDSAGASEGTMNRLIDRVDELISVSKSQLRVDEKILKMQH